jgi:hypothetical protein
MSFVDTQASIVLSFLGKLETELSKNLYSRGLGFDFSRKSYDEGDVTVKLSDIHAATRALACLIQEANKCQE